MISLIDIFSIDELTLVLKITSQCTCDIKHIIMLLIKTITLVLNSWAYIIISIIAHPIRLTVILTIMSISTVIAAVILQYSQRQLPWQITVILIPVYLFFYLIYLQKYLECYLLSPKMHKKVSKYIKQSKKCISITKKGDTYMYVRLSQWFIRLHLYVSDCTVYISLDVYQISLMRYTTVRYKILLLKATITNSQMNLNQINVWIFSIKIFSN